MNWKHLFWIIPISLILGLSIGYAVGDVSPVTIEYVYDMSEFEDFEGFDFGFDNETLEAIRMLDEDMIEPLNNVSQTCHIQFERCMDYCHTN